EEGIDYDEVFAPVAKIEAIRLFLAYASFMRFTVYQMDVKSAFLYDTIDEEVFEDILGVTTNTDDTNGVEADLGKMETTITASLTPTLRILKDHLKSQIIGPVDTPIQTRNNSKEMEEQNFIATIHQKSNPALF
nr:copia protein [Tanacetum cinerariifolium]